ncbi:MAG: type VI secretion system baseplate subunit TssK [Magnetococcus sp. DMHC-1]
MEWNNKVVWSEGMFLRTQHFQQQDRYVEKLVRGRVADLVSYPWGFAQLKINRDQLNIGKFAITECCGVFPDGTPFAIPDDANHPPPLDIPENSRNTPIYLTLPVNQPGGKEMAEPHVMGIITRHEIIEFEASDAIAASESTARITVAKPRLRYALGTSPLDGYVTLQIAHLVEKKENQVLLEDKQFIPPCLDLRASPVLSGYLAELQGVIHQRAESLGLRVSESGNRGVAEIADFLMLQLLNRVDPLLAHLAALPDVHPERLFALAISLAGELATFTASRKRPVVFPPYCHEALQKSFVPVFNELRTVLSAELGQVATPLSLEERKYGIWVAKLNDRTLVKHSRMILAVGADIPTEQLMAQFSQQVKICSVEQIRDLVNSALPGIPVRGLPVVPRQIPFHAGMTYYELDRANPYWEKLANSAAVAIHISGEFPDMRLELWAIKI